MRCRWSTFQIGEDRCCIISDGPSLVGLLNAHLPNPRRLFEIPFTPDRSRRHLVTIGWSKGKMKFYLDAKLVAEVPLEEPA